MDLFDSTASLGSVLFYPGENLGLPYEAEIPATINAVAVLIGALIGISQITINKEGGIIEKK